MLLRGLLGVKILAHVSSPSSPNCLCCGLPTVSASGLLFRVQGLGQYLQFLIGA